MDIPQELENSRDEVRESDFCQSDDDESFHDCLSDFSEEIDNGLVESSQLSEPKTLGKAITPNSISLTEDIDNGSDDSSLPSESKSLLGLEIFSSTISLTENIDRGSDNSNLPSEPKTRFGYETTSSGISLTEDIDKISDESNLPSETKPLFGHKTSSSSISFTAEKYKSSDNSNLPSESKTFSGHETTSSSISLTEDIDKISDESNLPSETKPPFGHKTSSSSISFTAEKYKRSDNSNLPSESKTFSGPETTSSSISLTEDIDKISDESNLPSETKPLFGHKTSISSISFTEEKYRSSDNSNLPSEQKTFSGHETTSRSISLTDENDIDSDNSNLPSKPKELFGQETTSSSISLAWCKPETGCRHIDVYEIKYKECNKRGVKWLSVTTETDQTNLIIPDLKCATEYEFKVRGVNEDGEDGPFSNSVKLSTSLSLAISVKDDSTKLKDGFPALYKLPVKLASVNTTEKTRKCTFGSGLSNVKVKTILLIGAAGSGKSTMIDAMMNYITGVSWEDDFRFSIVDLTENQDYQQTEFITCYTINSMKGSAIDYDLNIIDTPGLGDARGIARDKDIVDHIRQFFTSTGEQGIACLDAVCLVTQAPQCISPSQKYIFDSILSIFGQDIKDNIFALISFADDTVPPVLAALTEVGVPYKQPFKFNNSTIYSSLRKSEGDHFGKLFWKMGYDSFKAFFRQLVLVEPKSLQLTNDVLKIRKSLEATIQGLQPQIIEGMNKLNTLRQEQDILKRHKNEIEANSHFTYEADEVHVRQIDLDPGTYVTNCIECNRTCHFPCAIPDNESKVNCAAMLQGNCTVCPKKCHWGKHKNNSFRFQTDPVKVTKTYKNLKAKYETAQHNEKKQESVLASVKAEFRSHHNRVMAIVKEVQEKLKQSNEIALRPNSLSDLDYIDMLIESEKNERKYGWEQRVKLFQGMRKQSMLTAETANDSFNPWDDFEIVGEID